MKNLFLPFVVVALFAVGSCGDDASINPPVDVIKNLDSNEISMSIPLKYFFEVGNNTYSDSIIYKRLPFYMSEPNSTVLPDGRTSVQAGRNFTTSWYPGFDSLSYIIDPFKKEFTNIKFSYYQSGPNGSPYTGQGQYYQFYCHISKIPYTKKNGYLQASIKNDDFKNNIDSAVYKSYSWQYSSGEKYGTNYYENYPLLGTFADSSHFSISVKVE